MNRRCRLASQEAKAFCRSGSFLTTHNSFSQYLVHWSWAILIGITCIEPIAAAPALDWLPPVPISTTEVRLDPYVLSATGYSDGRDQRFPTKMLPIPDGSGRRLISTLGGMLRVVDMAGNFLDESLGGAYLDTNTVETVTGPFGYGLTSFAFHPEFAQTGANGFGKLYALVAEQPKANLAEYDFEPAFGATNAHAAVLVEYTLDPSAMGANRLIPSGAGQNVSRRELFIVRESGNSHNFGDLAFDDNNHLYVSAGDGRIDVNAPDFNGAVNIEAFNAQDLSTPLGKILRIDPLGSNSANGQYGVPAGASGNFFANDGDSNTLGEIYSYGHRNPWRISYDQSTGQLIMGDVGQFNIEEINIAANGGNFGWGSMTVPMEGKFAMNPIDGFDLTADIDGNMNGTGDIAEANGYTEPVFQYDHQDGVAATGGFIYRGSKMPALVGKYIFADYQGGDVATGPRLFAGDLATGNFEQLAISPLGKQFESNPITGNGIISFGVDEADELYLTLQDGQVYAVSSPTNPQAPLPPLPKVQNASFESGGPGENWKEFGNAVINSDIALDGTFSFDVAGQSTGTGNTSGAFQRIRINGGETLRAKLSTLVQTGESLAGTSNVAQLRLEYYNEFGAQINSAGFIDKTILQVADFSSTLDVWTEHELVDLAPAGAVEARLVLFFFQPALGAGAVHFDAVSLEALLADFDADLDVDAADLAAWKTGVGIQSGAIRANGDANGDGVVDGTDFLIWQRQLTATSPLSTQTVPEPHSFVLFAMALASMLAQRVRRF